MTSIERRKPLSETTLQIIITAFIASIPPTILAIATLITSKAAAKAATEAVEVAVVTAGVASQKADSLAEKTEMVHKLVNSGYAVQLKVSSVALRRLAEITKDTDDVSAAELAEKAVAEHAQKQNVVDIAEAKKESEETT